MSLFVALMLMSSPSVPQAKAASAPVTVPDKPAPAGKVSTASPRSIAARMQEEGYRAKYVTDDGTPYIQSSAERADFYIYLQGCKDNRDCHDAMIQSSYTKDKDNPPSLDKINIFNREHRWGRAYLDKEGDPVIEMDLLFTDQLMDEKAFSEALAIFSDLLSDFHKTIDW